MAKLTATDVQDIYMAYYCTSLCNRDIAALFGVHEVTINRILTGDTHTALHSRLFAWLHNNGLDYPPIPHKRCNYSAMTGQQVHTARQLRDYGLPVTAIAELMGIEPAAAFYHAINKRSYKWVTSYKRL